MSKFVDALQQQEQEYIRRAPLHLRTSKSTSIRHNLLLSPTRTNSASLRGPRRRTNSLNTASGKKDLKLLPRLEEENANLPQQVNKITQVIITMMLICIIIRTLLNSSWHKLRDKTQSWMKTPSQYVYSLIS